MSHPVAERYAQALYELARDADALEAVGESLLAVRDVLKSDAELVRRFCGPGISGRERHELVDRALAPDRHPLVANLLHVLVEKGRTNVFMDIMLAYFEKLEEAGGLVRLTIESAAPLSEERRASLEIRLADVFGRSVAAEYRVVPELIGGMRLRAASRLLDGSVRRRLDRLRSRLKAVG